MTTPVKLQCFTSTFSSNTEEVNVGQVICGECEYCDKAAEQRLQIKELPGALFCKTKQIKYETLDHLQRATFPRYILNTGAVTVASEDYIVSGLGFHEWKSKKEPTMIVIPLILSDIIKELRKAHEDELKDDERFLSVVNHLNVRSVKLNTLLDQLISQDLGHERQRPSQVNFTVKLKSLNAFELFSLLIIFLNRLPSPIFRLSKECCRVLLLLSDQLPRDENWVDEQKRKLVQSILEVSFFEKEKMKDIFGKIHELFDVDSGAQKYGLVIKNRLFFVLKENLRKTKQRMRRNIIRVILRNARFELSRHMQSLFRKRRNMTDSTKKKQNLMDTIFIHEAANLAFCFGPAFLKLSDEYDSRENRIKAMTSLLFYFDGSVMYNLEKKDLPFRKAMSCHPECPCGFGEPENIFDPAFRKLYIGAPFLHTDKKRKSPRKNSPNKAKKRVV